MKTKEELNQLKAECENFSEKLKELSPEEIKEVVGGVVFVKNTSKEGNEVIDKIMHQVEDNIMKKAQGNTHFNGGDPKYPPYDGGPYEYPIYYDI